MGSGRRVALVLLTAGMTTLAPGTLNRALGGDEPHTVRTLGDVGQYAVPAAGVVVAIAHKDRRGLGQLALSSAVSLGIVHTLKPLVDRQRPSGGGGSFPSGHTAFAFTGATFLHRRYGWAYGLPAYAVSAFVGYSRVHADEHWTSDVLAGAAIGVGASLIFTRPYRGVSVTAVAGNGRPGFSITLAW
jgi:membrane-associated phospholipid phosphatase